MCTSVISGLSILFMIYTNPLHTLYLYTHRFALFFLGGIIFVCFYAQVVRYILESEIMSVNRYRWFPLKEGDM